MVAWRCVRDASRLKEVVHEKESGVLFFVFEFMDGGNLYSKIKQFPDGMPEDKIRGIMYVCV